MIGTGEMTRLGPGRGFTLIEMVIVLGIIAILSSILVPTLTKYVSDTRLRKTQKDVELICAAIGQFHNDTALMPVSSNFGAGGSTRNDVETLEGPGDDPTDFAGDAADKWLNKVLDALDDQIMNNGANYPVVGGNRWRGPYLSQLRPDSWGNRYLVNVKWIQPSQINNLKSCFVLSAGPNGAIDTEFEGDTVAPAGDDIVCRIK